MSWFYIPPGGGGGGGSSMPVAPGADYWLVSDLTGTFVPVQVVAGSDGSQYIDSNGHIYIF